MGGTVAPYTSFRRKLRKGGALEKGVGGTMEERFGKIWVGGGI
jgi:hypothetical protein